MILEINTIYIYYIYIWYHIVYVYIYMQINVHGYIIIDGIGRHFWTCTPTVGPDSVNHPHRTPFVNLAMDPTNPSSKPALGHRLLSCPFSGASGYQTAKSALQLWCSEKWQCHSHQLQWSWWCSPEAGGFRPPVLDKPLLGTEHHLLESTNPKIW